MGDGASCTQHPAASRRPSFSWLRIAPPIAAAASVVLAALGAPAARAGTPAPTGPMSAARAASRAVSGTAAVATGARQLARIGEAPRLPAGATPGPVLAGSTGLHLDVVLRPSDPAGLAAYAGAVTDPSSPGYRHFLARGQFAARFGASRAAIATVRSDLAAAGLHLGATSPDGLLVPVTAAASAVAKALHTGFRTYRTAAGASGFAASVAPSLPVGAARSVAAIVGLASAPLAPAGLGQSIPPAAPLPSPKEPASPASPLGDGALRQAAGTATAPARTSPIETGGAQPCSTLLSATSPQGPYAADQLASHYSMSPLYAAGDLGAGVTIALYELEAEPNLAADLAPFDSCYGLAPSAVTTEEVDGGPGGQQAYDPQPGLETDLDVEVARELAPQASIVVYQGPNAYDAASAAGPLDTWAQIVDDDRAQVISSSWGACDDTSDEQYLTAESELFMQAAVQGQSVLAAAGDLGSCNSTSFTVAPTGGEDPASQPYVTAVGGTELAMAGSPPSPTVRSPGENAWGFGWGEGGGGGASTFPMPGYQSSSPGWLGVVSAASPTEPCDAPAGSYCREYPDVSAVSVDLGEQSAYEVWYWSWTSGGAVLGSVGGTSGATPLWAALVALADASPACSGSPVGFANPALYAVAASADGTSAFQDVIEGTNANWPGVGYRAGPGYDLASGLGTPVASALAPALCAPVGSLPPAAAPQLDALVPDAGLPGSSVTLSGAGLAGVTGVSFGGTSAAFAAQPDGDVVATVPPAAGGTVPVTVTAAGGESLARLFTVGAPVVDSVCTDGSCGSGSPSVITGSGFDNATAVSFGGQPAAGFSILSDEEILALPPGQAPPGTVDVTVTNAAGVSQAVAGDRWTIAPAAPPPVSNFGYPSSALFTVGSYSSYSAASFVVGTAPTPVLTLAGLLPPGVAFADHDGYATVSGVPQPGSGGTYPITITATNGAGSPARLSTQVTVDEAPQISLASPSVETTLGGEVDVAATVSGYPAPSLSLRGALPGALSFDPVDAAITGSAEQTGTFVVDIEASNGIGSPAVAALTIVVAPGSAPGSTTSPAVTTTAPATTTTAVPTAAGSAAAGAGAPSPPVSPGGEPATTTSAPTTTTVVAVPRAGPGPGPGGEPAPARAGGRLPFMRVEVAARVRLRRRVALSVVLSGPGAAGLYGPVAVTTRRREAVRGRVRAADGTVPPMRSVTVLLARGVVRHGRARIVLGGSQIGRGRHVLVVSYLGPRRIRARVVRRVITVVR